MSKIALITQEQSQILAGQKFALSCHYNPVQDCQGNWIITKEEIEQTTNPDFIWVKNLELSDYCPPIIERPEILNS
jgi:hypothetical protein